MTGAANQARGRRRRPRVFNVRKKVTPGASPGTVSIDESAPAPAVRVLCYDQTGFEEATLEEVGELADWLDRRAVCWVNVDGLGDAGVLGAIAELGGMHRLVLEDIVNVHQRPKMEEYDELLYVVARMQLPDAVESEQVSMWVAENLLISFQEQAGDCFDLVRKRIRDAKGRIRERGADYLAYALLDAIVDGYFPVLERLGERLEDLEEAAITTPGAATIQHIHDIKRELLMLRRILWPTREMLSAALRLEMPVFTDGTRVYLRDCYDHAIQVLDIVESYREMGSSLTDVYLSTASNRMNEIMKVLTVIATLFIPLTFVAGLYGMNFDPNSSPLNMPELRWYFGYPLCLGVMLVIGVVQLLYFRRLGWIGKRQR